MRIQEILGNNGAESPITFMESSSKAQILELIRAILIPLKSLKVKKITVDQFMDHIKSNEMLDGIEFDQNYIINLLGKSRLVHKIQADPENNGLMTIYFDFPVGERQIDAREAEKEKNQIKKAAMRQIKNKLK